MSLVNDMVEGSNGFFHGGEAIGLVRVDDVDIAELKALEGGREAFDDVFAREAVVID